VPDDSDPPAVRIVQAGDAAFHDLERAFRAVDVEHEPAGRRAVADPSQPVRKHAEREVAGEEARQQHDRTAVTGRHLLAPPGRIGEQPRELKLPSGLGQGAPTPRATARCQAAWT
jgi:hypothetical protein